MLHKHYQMSGLGQSVRSGIGELKPISVKYSFSDKIQSAFPIIPHGQSSICHIKLSKWLPITTSVAMWDVPLSL